MGLREIQRIHEEANLPKEKKYYKITRISKKRQEKLKKEKENKTDSAKDKWFEERRLEMTGKCIFCGSPTEKKNDETYRRSIAHLLAKRKAQFPSVALNPFNSLELCFFYNSCHTNFDNQIITLEDIKNEYPKAWEIIVDKFLKIYPSIAHEERYRIPECLIMELK